MLYELEWFIWDAVQCENGGASQRAHMEGIRIHIGIVVILFA